MVELSKSEIRKTMGTSLGTAFGIVIGMVWTQVVLSAFATGGIPLTTTGGTWSQWGLFVVNGCDCNNYMCCRNNNAEQMGRESNNIPTSSTLSL
ncbi:MAG: hypothetical protein MPEBLZ_03260 [Candidatus Methanoperedens nitroreducens]|uniref:Uncharacterized protein n=1 Tax=Candidatus Methanoperedens nitratireducens TaxID=1392998 RepID=A0A0P8ADE9_9EURY|nr:MAG: hypothetical protein MPEBLZ_03260 [Candidatus Methanoperedens sp. BLZ1]